MRKTPLFLLAACIVGAAFSAAASNPITVLATNVGYPGNMLVDGGNVYWIDNLTGHILSVSKNPGGSVSTLGTAPIGGDLVQDAASIYFQDATKPGPYVADYALTKVSKAGYSSSTIGSQYAHGGTLGIGPGNGMLYYSSLRDVPLDLNDVFLGVATMPAVGGADQMLIYNDYGFGNGTFDGTYYTGLAALLHDNLQYWIGGNPGWFSADSTYLYWQDGSFQDSIWQMPLVGGSASPIVAGRTGVRQIATPTTGAAAGSIFWIEGTTLGSYRLMRRDVGGQIITVVTNIGSFDRCFAVDDATVYCEQNGGIVQVSINGGKPTVISSVLNVQGVDGLVIDDNYIYWGNVWGDIMRLPRPGVPTPPPPSAPIALQVNGPGTVTPVYNGQSLVIGKAYSISAKPKKGCLFTGWTGSTNSALAKLTFVMATNFSLTAGFVDTTRPVLAVTYPKPKKTVVGPVITALGKAKDNVAVAAVYYQLNGGGWTQASGTTLWSVTNLTVISGTNFLSAYAVDTSNNCSLTNTISFSY